jgi:HK97 family phage prohead protease
MDSKQQTKLDRAQYMEAQGCQFRHFAMFELRAGGEDEAGALYVEGLVTPFNSPTVLYSYDGVDYKEQIDAKAFDSADLSDVIFNYNHGGKVVARTRNQTLRIWVESDGLHARARLDGTEEGKRLYEEIKGGYIDRMSFAFSIGESSYDVDAHMRTILKVKKVYDVSAVDIPAYDTTSISARSFFEAEAEKEHKAAEAAKVRGELQRKLLQAQVTLTNKIYGGNEHE